MRAVDTHCHLNFSSFDADRSAVIADLSDRAIGCIAVATDFDSVDDIAELSQNNPLVWGSVGLHPKEMSTGAPVRLSQEIDRWKGLFSQNKKLVAVGEVGLDYFDPVANENKPISPSELGHDSSSGSDVDRQKAGLRQLLTFAIEINQPVIFHCREAYGDLKTIVGDYPGIRGVVHCFSGTNNQAQDFLEMGLYLSLTNMLAYPKNDALRATVKMLPLSKLMIETDSPFLPPPELRGQRNDPRQVVAVAAALAQIKETTLEAVLEQTTETAKNFFGLGGK